MKYNKPAGWHIYREFIMLSAVVDALWTKTMARTPKMTVAISSGSFQFSAPSIADRALSLLRSMEVLLKRLMKVYLDNYRMFWEMLTKSEHRIEKVSSIESITWKSWWSCIKYRHMPKDCANHICSNLDLTIIKNWCWERNTAVQPYLNLLIS